MIPILLRDLRWKLLLLLLVAWVMYLLEPAFHQHGVPTPEQAVGLSALGVSATLSYFAGVAMVVLLAGFISEDRREGYTRLLFSHPTRPLAYYGLRWALAWLIALTAALLFLVVGQALAWGEWRGGLAGLLLAAASATVYGGLMAFLSAALPRGDAWVAFLLFLPNLVPPALFPLFAGLTNTLQAMPNALRLLLFFLLPPQWALQTVWQGLLDGVVAWAALGYAVAYGLVWLGLGAVVLRARDLP